MEALATGSAAQLSSPIVVTGMHRSGTSAITQLLGANGFQLGDHSGLVEATEFNVHGHFERAEIVAFNDRVLAAASGSWRSPPERDQLSSVSRESIEEGELLLERFASECGTNSAPVVVKDPRISILMPLWRKIAGPRAIFVFCVRSPASVAASLFRRDEISVTDGVALWASYCQSFLAELGEAQHIIVDTDRVHAEVEYRKLIVATLKRECRLPETTFADTIDNSVFHEQPLREEFGLLVPVDSARKYAWLIRASENVQVQRGAGPLAQCVNESAHPASQEFYHALKLQAAQERRWAAEAVAGQMSVELASALAKLERHELRTELQREQFVGREDWAETPDGLWVQKGEPPEQVIQRARHEAELLREQVRALRDSSEEQARELSATQSREHELAQQLQTAQVTLAGVLSSRSWRITRPLRRKHRNDDDADAPSDAEIAEARAEYPGISWDWYLQQNPDVAEQGCDPAWHYRHFGWLEGRRPVPWSNPTGPPVEGSEPFSIYVKRGITTVQEPPRSAVSMHLFYPDFTSRLEDRLAALDTDVDVFVTVPEGFDSSGLRRWAQLPRVGDLVVRNVPNRGRNFAPLLVEFGERLLDYDYVIHAHSKKSLRTGRDQLGWAEECLEAALPVSGRLAARIRTLQEDSAIGGFRPGASQYLPYWAFHWLQNAHWGRLAGVSDIAPQDSFIEYPVGGMFLVRTAAIRSLLAKRWAYADFPVEAGQADGTMQHAIERLVGHLVTQAGRRFAVPASQNQSPVREFVLEAALAQLKRVAEQGSLDDDRLTVSFDLFDTLVERRGLMTEQAKWAAGRHAADLGLTGAEAYVDLRNGIERELRDQLVGREDVSLEEVTTGCVCALGMTGSEAADVAQVLASAEVAADAAILIPRGGLFSIFVRRLRSGLPTLVTSDSFYSSEDLTRILRSLGAPISHENVLSSASTGARKDRGDVWTLLEQDRSLDAGSFLHVGDNVVSDIQRPGDRLIPTAHVLNARDRWHLATGRLLSQPERQPPTRALDDSLERVLASELAQMELTRVFERPRKEDLARR